MNFKQKKQIVENKIFLKTTLVQIIKSEKVHLLKDKNKKISDNYRHSHVIVKENFTFLFSNNLLNIWRPASQCDIKIYHF